MQKNVKSIFLVATLLFLLVGVSAISASEVSDGTTVLEDNADTVASEVTTTTTDNKIVDTTTKNIKTEEQSTDLYVSDTDGSDDNSGTNDSPYKTIQKALDQTTADSTFNIHIAEGIYKGLGNTNLTVNGNYNINFIGNGNNTIFDGEAEYDIDLAPYHWESSPIWSFYTNDTGNYFMTIKKGNGLIKVSDMTIQNMYTFGGSSISAYRHATIDNYANLIVNNTIFLSNHAGVGSAIRNNKDATLTVDNSYFENNTKSSSTGNDGIIYNNGTATILNSTFNHNYARWSTILNDKNITVINSTLSNNIGYDGKSEYKYGAGFGFNTGGADFYNLGYFLTYNNIINCTFINNDQCDIYGYAGNLVANGNNFTDSTGIYITDNSGEYNHDYLIENNTFENMIPSEITVTLSSGLNTFAIMTDIINGSLKISNNTIKSDNGTLITVNKAIINNNNLTKESDNCILVKDNGSIIENNSINGGTITVNGADNSIKYNTINSNNQFTINVNGINNNITDNLLTSKGLDGDNSVILSKSPNLVEYNSAENTIYCSPDVTESQEGTIHNPTTITDALTKVTNEGTIHLLSGENGEYKLTNTISINNNIPSTVKSFRLYGDNITLDGQNNVQILNIQKAINLTIENITFINGKGANGGAIYSTSATINIKNVNFYNNYATENGGAIYGFELFANGKNIFKNNTAPSGGAIYVRGTTTSMPRPPFQTTIPATLSIKGNNTFIDNSASTNGGSISFVTGSLTVHNSTFISSTANRGGAINYVSTTGAVNLTENQFIDCVSNNETLSITSTNKNIKNNTFINSSISTNLQISTRNDTVLPIKVNDNVYFDISTSLVHPDYYDEDILNKTDLTSNTFYDVYVNDELKTTTPTNAKAFNVTLDNSNDNIIYLQSNTNKTSNKIILDVEIDNLKNVYIITNLTNTTYNNSANITVKVFDKTNTPVSDCGTIEVYDNDMIIGSNTTINGIANIETIKITNMGNINLTIKYLTNTTYNNQTNTSTITVRNTDVYTSPDVTETNLGTIDKPTTIEDAFTKVTNEGTIHLLAGTNGVYTINQPITVSNGKISSLNITGEDSSVTLDAQSQSNIIINYRMTLQINNLKFINGYSTNGGAINNAGGTLIINGTNIFNNNSADNGGAIYNQGRLTIIGNNIFANSSTTKSGGAIYSTENMTILGNNTFINNTVTTSIQEIGGGAIYYSTSNYQNGNIYINGTNSFINNQVKGNQKVYGGAIWVYSPRNNQNNRVSYQSIKIEGQNLFENNKVSSKSLATGGAINANGNIIIEGENSFISNSVEDYSYSGYGGAVYITSGNISINNSNKFINNKATDRGGTLFLSGIMGAQANITGNNIFTNSSAEEQGGILYLTGYNTTISGNIFSNSSSEYGGAIYIPSNNYNNIQCNIINNTFQNNTATQGGAIYTSQAITEFTLQDNTFTNINSDNETLNLNHSGIKTLENNTLINCSIGLEEFTLTSDETATPITSDTPVTLNITPTLTYPEYYDDDLISRMGYQIFINDENKYDINENPYTFQADSTGTLNIYAHSPLLKANTNTITITILDSLSLKIDDITTTIGDTINITARITIGTQTQTNITKGKVSFKVNGKTIKDANGKTIYAKVTNGTATITDYVVPDTWNENTTIQAVYTGLSQCDKLTSEKTTIKIEKEELTITTSDVTATAGQTITLSATLSDTSINTGKIVFKINGKTVKDANGKVIYAKVVNGQVTVNYTIPDDMKAKDYNITATFIAPNYDKIEATAVMTVVKA